MPELKLKKLSGDPKAGKFNIVEKYKVMEAHGPFNQGAIVARKTMKNTEASLTDSYERQVRKAAELGEFGPGNGLVLHDKNGNPSAALLPWIEGPQPTDDEIADFLIDLYTQKKHLIIDAYVKENFIKTNGKIVCIDTGKAHSFEASSEEKVSQAAFQEWAETEEDELDRLIENLRTSNEAAHHQLTKTIAALLYLRLVYPEIEDASFLKNENDTIKKLASAYNNITRGEVQPLISIDNHTNTLTIDSFLEKNAALSKFKLFDDDKKNEQVTNTLRHFRLHCGSVSTDHAYLFNFLVDKALYKNTVDRLTIMQSISAPQAKFLRYYLECSTDNFNEKELLSALDKMIELKSAEQIENKNNENYNDKIDLYEFMRSDPLADCTTKETKDFFKNYLNEKNEKESCERILDQTKARVLSQQIIEINQPAHTATITTMAHEHHERPYEKFAANIEKILKKYINSRVESKGDALSFKKLFFNKSLTQEKARDAANLIEQIKSSHNSCDMIEHILKSLDKNKALSKKANQSTGEYEKALLIALNAISPSAEEIEAYNQEKQGIKDVKKVLDQAEKAMLRQSINSLKTLANKL